MKISRYLPKSNNLALTKSTNRSFSKKLGILLAIFALGIIQLSPSRLLAGDEVESFFPKDNDVFIHINIDALLASDLCKDYAMTMIKDALGKKEVKDITSMLGIDPLKDLNHIYMVAPFDPTNSDPKGTILLKGNFDVNKINGSLEKIAKKDETFTVQKIGDKSGFKIMVPNSPVPLYGALLDSKYLILASDKNIVADGFAAASGTKKSVLNPKLLALVKKLDPKAAFSFTGYLTGKLDKLPIPTGDATKDLDKIESLTLEFSLEKGAKLSGNLVTTDSKVAKNYHEQVSSLFQAAPLLLGSNPAMKPVIEVLKKSAPKLEDKTIFLNFEISNSQIKSIIGKE